MFPRWPFFPGLPALIRVLGELGRDDVLIFAVNQLAFLVALAGLYRLARRHASTRAVGLAVWSLALFPASFVFSMTYPSAIFLATSVWAFLLVEDHLDLVAGLLAAGAAIVRPNGIVVAIALVFAVRTLRRAVLVAGPAVIVIGAWCWYCYDRTGDAFVFLTTKARWEEISAVGLFDGHAKLSVVPHGLLALGAIAVVVLQRRRIPGSWILLTAAVVAPVSAHRHGRARAVHERVLPAVRRRRSDPRPLVARRAVRAAHRVGVRDGGVRLGRRPLSTRALSVLRFDAVGELLLEAPRQWRARVVAVRLDRRVSR